MLKKLRQLVIISATLGIILMPFAYSGAAHAIDVVSTPCSNTAVASSPACQDSQSTTNPLFGPTGILTVAVKILSIVVGVFAVIFVIIQGIRITLSAGDAQAVAKARSGLIYALVGVAIAAMAQALVAFVLNKVQ